jgi:hypothetical protein
MERRKRLLLACVGLLISVVLFVKEIIAPEESHYWHALGLYLYGGGVIALFLYSLFVYRNKV